MNVFMVSKGEKYEGGNVIGVALSLKVATNIAKNAFDKWDWEDKKQVNEFHWTGGCDYISIEEMKITE